jgi:rubrerythrin
MYGEYLTRVLPEQFQVEVSAWAAEEAQHGQALRRWLALADPEFDVEASFARYIELPYHQGETVAGRGGVSHELLSRCVVEAFASGYYFALSDQTHEPLLRNICRRLMADESRHFAQFRSMLATAPKLGLWTGMRVTIRRILELADDQIVFAAHCANHRGAYDRVLVAGEGPTSQPKRRRAVAVE